MGSDDITPDKKTDEPKATHYSLTWFTNGYRPTKKGVRERKARERANVIHLPSFGCCSFPG